MAHEYVVWHMNM